MTTTPFAIEHANDQTIPKLLHRNATHYGDLPALSTLDDPDQPTLTWSALRDEIATLARGLDDLGLRRGDRVLIMAPSSPEHLIADLAAVHIGAISCTVYQTLSPEQITYIAQHSNATMAVLGSRAELLRWQPALAQLPGLRHVVIIDDTGVTTDDGRQLAWEAVRRRGAQLHAADPQIFDTGWAEIRPDDALSVVYTSGTTGNPKGVVLTHRGVIYHAYTMLELHRCPMHMTNIAYLPLAHIAERQGSIYMPIVGAGHVHTLAEPSAVAAALPRVRPHQFFAVPRIVEKMAARLAGMQQTLPDPDRAQMTVATEMRRKSYQLRGSGQQVPTVVTERIAELDTEVLAPIRRAMGLDRLHFFPCGSAPVPIEALSTLAGIGVDVYELLGLSETSGVITANHAEAFRVGTVGRPIGDTEIAIADDGEIMVRGTLVVPGYLQADGTIRSLTDDDGWFATGDVGVVDSDGFLTVTDRKKELIITAGGKNIAPARIEALLKEHPLIGHAVAIGDRRPYITALITLDRDTLHAWAETQGLSADTTALIDRREVLGQIEDAVQAANARLARVEQVKRFRLIGDDWTAATGEVTETLKLKRRIVHARYAAEIDALYNEG
ncbi:AMP-dependent synthetase/ligase [Nocardia farcinica]|uniref:AMP-dependent synthetase/ligase n=1 Tax=Nocardia farcinica TaxID=37329 RepID=UPI002456C744|nr:AMP-dependent synthetase/ligase [Nocardia farcinica]